MDSPASGEAGQREQIEGKREKRIENPVIKLRDYKSRTAGSS
ncbi:hypothetical protein [Algoriphagus iocasae]|nr:hypothetical protein [Algoriphagus iocasae]